MPRSEEMLFKLACRATRLIFFAFGFGIASWAPMVPFVKTKLQANDAELGLVLLASGMGALLSMPLAAFLVHNFGTRLMTVLWSMIVVIIFPFLVIADTSVTVAFVLFLFGISTGFWNVSINAHAVQVESKASIPIMSGLHCFFSTGGLCGALTVSALLELGFSLLFCALAVSVTMGLIILLNWKNLLPMEKRAIPSCDEPRVSRRDGFSFPDIRVLLLGTLCFASFMTEGSMLDWSAEFLRTTLNYSASIAGIGFALFSTGMVLGRFTGDRIIHWKGTMFLFQVGSFLAASGLVLVVTAGIGMQEMLGFFLIGLGASNIVPILFSASGRVPSASPSFNLTIVTTFGYMGILIGPAFIGFIAEATSLSFAFGCISVFLFAVGFSGRYVLKDLVIDRYISIQS
ncbi:MAG TPA: MFS transporter [Parachlamydiaceae bacterium]|nr:MFS transporter [Parachlamydiaceae bacterium]